MVDFGPLHRRPVIAGALFLAGGTLSLHALGDAAVLPDLGQYLGLALQAVIGLIGLLGPTLMMLRSAMGKREGLVRSEVIERLSALEARVARMEAER